MSWTSDHIAWQKKNTGGFAQSVANGKKHLATVAAARDNAESLRNQVRPLDADRKSCEETVQKRTGTAGGSVKTAEGKAQAVRKAKGKTTARKGDGDAKDGKLEQLEREAEELVRRAGKDVEEAGKAVGEAVDKGLEKTRKFIRSILG